MADAFPLSGQIDPGSFPFLLVRLHLQGATGSLKVEGPSYQKALYFRGGRILFGSSNDPRDQLGAILIEAGRITPEQLEDVNTKVGPGNPLAKVLADTGYVSQRELSDAARAKVERILSDLIAYTSGGFEFEDGVLPKGAVDLKLSTPRVVLAAVRRVADRAFVLRHLDLETVLAPTADLAEHLAEIQGEAGGLVEHLDGRSTLKQAAAHTTVDEFDAAKIGSALLFLGYAEKTEAPVADAGDVALGVDDVAPFSFDDADDDLPATVAMAAPSFEPEAEAEPVFTPADNAADDFQITDPAAFAPAEPADEPLVAKDIDEGPSLDSTLMLGRAPRFTLEDEPPAPQRTSETVMLDSAPDFSRMPLEDEPAPAPAPAPPAAKPSKDDLAAVDAILHPEKARPAPAAAPRPSSIPRPTPRRVPQASRRPLLLGILAATALAVIGAAFWYLMSAPEPASTALTTPPPSTVVTVAPSVAPPPPGAGPVQALPVPGASAAPPVTVAPPVTTLARPPATTFAPAPPPTTLRPAPPAPPASGGSLGDAHAALAAHRIPDAARSFSSAVRAAPAGSATLQLLVACSADTIQKAVDTVGAQQLIILPVDLRGRACYRVSWGLYANASAANAAIGSVPAYFRNEGVKPRVVTTAELAR